MLFETALKRVVNGNEKLMYISFFGTQQQEDLGEREGEGGGDMIWKFKFQL